MCSSEFESALVLSDAIPPPQDSAHSVVLTTPELSPCLALPASGHKDHAPIDLFSASDCFHTQQRCLISPPSSAFFPLTSSSCLDVSLHCNNAVSFSVMPPVLSPHLHTHTLPASTFVSLSGLLHKHTLTQFPLY